jgi:hypothetical protein
MYMRKLGLTKYLDPDENVLNTRIRRISYEAWFLIPEILSIVSALAILGVGIYLALLIVKLSQYGMTHWWFFPVACTIAYSLYILRDRRRSLYGAIEIIAGSAAIFSSIVTVSNSDFARFVSLTGGIYIIVRGMDNFDAGKENLIKYGEPGSAVEQDFGVSIRRFWAKWIKFDYENEARFQQSLKAEKDRRWEALLKEWEEEDEKAKEVELASTTRRPNA